MTITPNQSDRDLWKYLLDATKSQCTMMDTCDPATAELQAIAAHRQKAVADERARCAAIAEKYPERDPGEDGSGYWAANEIAAAIKEPRP